MSRVTGVIVLLAIIGGTLFLIVKADQGSMDAIETAKKNCLALGGVPNEHIVGIKTNMPDTEVTCVKGGKVIPTNK
jgi:hypothetical protein